MKTKYKTIGLLFGTLVVGILVGMLLHATFLRSQFRKHIHKIRTEDGFIQRFEDLIQPTEEQRVQLETVLKKHFEEMDKQRDVFRALMDSLKADIDSVLTEEQRQRLQKNMFLERSKSPRRPPFPQHDFMEPPPGGPPPEPPDNRR
jgi:septal ring factor EnvC (AmiA/AmiB activator)